MQTFVQTALSVSILFVAAELICHFCPKDRMLTFVRGLIITVLLISLISTAKGIGNEFSLDGFTLPPQDNRLNEYLEGELVASAERQTTDYIDGLLKTISVDAKKINVFTDKNEENSIVIEKIEVITAYESDRERALALLKNTVGKKIAIEVILEEDKE